MANCVSINVLNVAQIIIYYHYILTIKKACKIVPKTSY